MSTRFLFVVPVVLAAACSSTSNVTNPTVDGGTSAPDGTAPVVVDCPAPTKGPTVHDAYITASETWTADASPHVIKGTLLQQKDSVLTIEPCAEVLFEKDASLALRTGKILAEGSATKPIHIAGKDGAAWKYLEIGKDASVRLAYVTMEGGGGPDTGNDGAAIYVSGDDNLPADPLLYVDHLTMKGALGAGIQMANKAMFVAGSHDLTITGSGSDEFPYPLSVQEHSIDTLPTGTFTGNKKDAIYLRLNGAGTAGDGLKVDATLHERGVPYRLDAGFNVSANEDGKLSTLTIEPGVTIQVAKGKAFKVDSYTGDTPATGVLRALGTAERPIVFTSAEDAPAPGDWMGLWFGLTPSANNKLDHVIVEYAGASCGCSLSSCSTITTYEGAVLFSNRPDGASPQMITNSTFRHIAGHGIVEGWQFPKDDSRHELIDFTPTNTFDVTKCSQTLPGVTTSAGCPNPKPQCF